MHLVSCKNGKKGFANLQSNTKLTCKADLFPSIDKKIFQFLIYKITKTLSTLCSFKIHFF